MPQFARIAVTAVICLVALPALGQEVKDLPRQTYSADPFHTSVIFRLNHLGFSTFIASFDEVEATLDLDVDDPGNARLDVAIATASLDLPFGGDGFLETMIGPEWLNAQAHPEITFRSTAVAMTGDNSADVTGDLTIAGVTQPATLDVTYNGGWAKGPFEPFSRLGFSARTSISRSAFGMDFGVPPPGSEMGVGDKISVEIEAEMTGPPAP